VAVAVRRGSTDARSVAAEDRHRTNNRSSRQLGMSGVLKLFNSKVVGKLRGCDSLFELFLRGRKGKFCVVPE
jgi:hypothetical protein